MGMSRSLERVIWAVVVLAAVVFGLLGRNSKSEEESGDATVRNSSSSSNRSARSGESDSTTTKGVARDETSLRKFASQALSTPSRTERYQRVMKMLDETTAENWRTIWNEYIRQTLEEGRVHESEWSLFMNRVGELAGADAMEFFTHNAQNEYTFNRREVLQGWASENPEAAYQWLKAQPEDQRVAEFWGAVLDGAAARDPKMAIDWLKEVPPNFSDRVAAKIVGSQVQSTGLAGTIVTLEEMAATVPEGTEPPKYMQAFYRELKSRAQRLDWLGKAYPDFKLLNPQMDSLQAVFEKDRPPVPVAEGN
jgi:hypothetical protein